MMSCRHVDTSLKNQPDSPVRMCGMGLVLPFLAVLAIGLFGLSATVYAQAGKNQPNSKEPTRTAKDKTDVHGQWGEAAGGLRLRAVAVAPETDEQKLDIAGSSLAAEYASAKEVTLLVEMQNVSDKPIS
jgi:hypothetical protein